MDLDLKAPDIPNLTPKIAVFGVGGAGGNAVANMINAKLQGANFIVANTDAQALQHSNCTTKLQLGKSVEGLGAGADPDGSSRHPVPRAWSNRRRIRLPGPPWRFPGHSHCR